MGLGVWGSVAALIPSPTAKIALLVAPLLFVFLWWSCGHRDRWIRAFFVCALLLPPLPIALGDSGPHVAPLLVLLGIIYGVALQQKRDPIDVTLLRSAAVLVFSLGLSAAIAALSTTAEIALLSEFRTALFAIGPLVLMHALQSTYRSALRACRACCFGSQLSAACSPVSTFTSNFRHRRDSAPSLSGLKTRCSVERRVFSMRQARWVTFVLSSWCLRL